MANTAYKFWVWAPICATLLAGVILTSIARNPITFICFPFRLVGRYVYDVAMSAVSELDSELAAGLHTVGLGFVLEPRPSHNNDVSALPPHPYGDRSSPLTSVCSLVGWVLALAFGLRRA